MVARAHFVNYSILEFNYNMAQHNIIFSIRRTYVCLWVIQYIKSHFTELLKD